MQHLHNQKLAEVFASIPFNRLLGMQLDEIAGTHIVMSFPMQSKLVGNYLHGILHGGVISSVLDMAGGVAVMVGALKRHTDKTLEELSIILGKSSTINLHIDYLRPGKGEKFIAKAYLVQSGNQISFARMELFNQEDQLIASGSGAYSVK